MKKVYGILIASLFACTCYSQSILTKGDVFDFDVGDEFQLQKDGQGTPPTYIRKVILAKTLSSGNTVVDYQIEESRIVYNNNMTITVIPPTTLTEVHSNLGDTVDYPFMYFMFGDTVGDSVYASSTHNGRLLAEHYRANTAPLSSGYSRTRWGNGLGLVFFEANAPGDGISEYYTLIYYRKGGETFGSIVTDVPEPIEKEAVVIYPNPTHEQLRVTHGVLASDIEFEVVDLEGKVILAGRLPESGILWVSDLAEGRYWLRLWNEGGEEGHMFVKQ